MKIMSTVLHIALLFCIYGLSPGKNYEKNLNLVNLSSIEGNLIDSAHPSKTNPYQIQFPAFIDVDIPWLCEPVYHSLTFYNDYYVAEKPDHTFVIDLNGNILKTLEFSFHIGYIQGFKEGCDFAVVIKDSKYGVINKNWEVIIPFEYDDMSDIKDNMVFAVNNSYSGYLNLLSKKQIPMVNDMWGYNNDNNFSEGLAAEYNYDGNPIYFINTNGERVLRLPDDLKDCSPFSNGIAGYRFIDDMTVFINTQGKELFRKKIVTPMILKGDADYVDISKLRKIPLFNDKGLLYIPKDAYFSEYEVINAKGNLVDPPNISRTFNHNFNPEHNENGIYGYVNKQEELIIPYQFSKACYFVNGIAFVETTAVNNGIDGKSLSWSVIDEKGFFLIPYQSFKNRGDGLEDNGLSQSNLHTILTVNDKLGAVNVKKINPTIYLNGTPLKFNNYPQLIKGNVLIPASGIEDNFYCEVTSNNDEIKIKHYNKVIKAKSGSTTYYLNGAEKQAPVAPFFLNGEALIPIDYLKDLIHFSSSWSEKERKLEIIMK